jgi:hypothetical protein
LGNGSVRRNGVIVPVLEALGWLKPGEAVESGSATPGKVANKESNEWFCRITTIRCFTGEIESEPVPEPGGSETVIGPRQPTESKERKARPNNKNERILIYESSEIDLQLGGAAWNLRQERRQALFQLDYEED